MSGTSPVPPAARGLRIRLLNWRDTGHPEAGGAELFVAEVAARLVSWGAEVSVFTSRAPGQAREELVDGLRTVRRGNRWTVYPHALLDLLRSRNEVDLVIDCQNGLPFFAPLVLPRGAAVVLVIHHVHQQQFAAHFPPLLAWIGRWLEGPLSRLVYGSRPLAVVSPSTRAEVRRELRLRGPVHVVPNGTTSPQLPVPTQRRPRSSSPMLVCVGRLVVHKRMDRLLTALPALLQAVPDLAVHVVGDGPERRRLERLAARLGVEAAVTFHGRVDSAVRDALLAQAWLTVNPSMGEGWGLGVLEAAAMGVPAVVADVPGLRDAVLGGRTGWLVPDGEDFGQALRQAVTLLRDDREAARWADRCTAWAGNFTWDRTAARLLDVGLSELRRRRSTRQERRRRSDLVTWAELRVADAARFAARATRGLRPEDLWRQEGDRAFLLCHACDEVDMRTVGERLGGDLVSAGVATGAQLLGDLSPGPRRGSAGARRPPDGVSARTW